MAHYAFLDENNIVTEVITGVDENTLIDGLTPEQAYSQLKDQPCLRTSYNGKIRGNYAGVGYSYLPDLDIFIYPQCHPEAVLNAETAQWDCVNPKHVINRVS